MKKIAFVLALGILIQTVPAPVHASHPQDTTGLGAIAGAGLLTYLLFFQGGPAAPPAAKATGDEFADLNNNSAFNSLLKQVAGGSLNSLEILK